MTQNNPRVPHERKRVMKSEMKTVTVAKGINLCTCRVSGFKTANVAISFAMPLSDGKNAARAVLINLLAKTNRDYPTMKEMGTKLSMLYGASLGAGIIKSGESQKIRLSMECIDDGFALSGESIILEALSLMLDLIFRPDAENGSFPEKNVEREKRLLIEHIKSLDDDKISYAARKMIEEMCRDEDFSISKYGTAEEIEKLTGKDVFAAFTDILLHAPVQIDVVGDIDECKVEELVRERFSKIQREKVTELHTEFLSEAYDEKEIRETQEINQCKLVIGMRAGMTYDRDNYAAIKVMNDIFGAGVYSKLFLNVREKQSLCYYCSSSLDAGKGLIIVQSGVEKANIGKAIESIKHEFRDMQLGNFDDETIEASKLSLIDGLSSVGDTPADIMQWYSSQMTASTVTSPDELIEQIKAVTKEEIMTAAMFVTTDTIFVLEN